MGSSEKLVIFDVDGTLNMTETYAVPVYRMVLEQMGVYRFTDEMLRGRIGASFTDDIKYFFGSQAEEKKEQFEKLIGKYWMDGIRHKARTFPHTAEVLKELKAEGYRLAICSNAAEEEIHSVLNALGITDYFDYIQGITKEQTKSRSLGCLLDRVKPEWAVMTGDRFYDRDAAEDNHIPFVACLYGYGQEDEFSKEDRSITDIRQLPSVLKAIKKTE